MFDERDRQYFYDEFKNNGYQVGSYEDFKKDLNNKEDRDWYYNEAKNMGYDVGTQADFDKMVLEAAPSSTPVSSAPSSTKKTTQEKQVPKAEPVQKPQAQQPSNDEGGGLISNILHVRKKNPQTGKWEDESLGDAAKDFGDVFVDKLKEMPGRMISAVSGFFGGSDQTPQEVNQSSVNSNQAPSIAQHPLQAQGEASPSAKENAPATPNVVNNEGLVDAKFANYLEDWKKRPNKDSTYFENFVADLEAEGMNPDEAIQATRNALDRYADRSALDVTNKVVSSLPDDTVQDAEKNIEAQWYSHGVQDKLRQEATAMGVSYDDYVAHYLKPAMVESLVQKYGQNYRNIAEGIATRLYSHEEHVQDRLMNQDINDALSDVISKYTSTSVAKAIQDAEVASNAQMGKYNEQSKYVDSASPFAIGAISEANKTRDPQKILSDLQKKFGKLYQNPQFLNDMSNAAFKVMQRYGLNGGLSGDPKQFKPMINAAIKNELDQLETKGMIPKGSADYILKTGIENTIIGKVSRKIMQTDYQNWLEDVANQQYQPGFWERVGSGALTFAGDAWSYWLPGAAGGKLTKSMLAKAEGRLAGDLMAKGMEAKMAERAAKMLIGKSKSMALKTGAVHGAVTFGGQSAISKPIDEVYRTGQFDENGNVYNPSVGKILANTLGEVAKQSLYGASLPGTTIANIIGKGRGLAANILADVGGKVVDSGIMTGQQMLERMAQDPSFKPTGKVFAESALESMANLTSIGLPGWMGKYTRFKDAKEFNRKFDFNDQDIAELKKFGYDDLRDAFEKLGINGYRADGEGVQMMGQLTDKYMSLMNDKSVPEVLKAKMMAVVEGKRPSSFSPVIDSEVYLGDDGKYYLDTYNKEGGVVDRKEYSSHEAARKDEKKLDFEKSLNITSEYEKAYHTDALQDRLNTVYEQARDKYAAGEQLTDEDKAAIYLHQNAGAIGDIMQKQQKGMELTEQEQQMVNSYRHFYDSAFENSPIMKEYVRTFEDSQGVEHGTLRKALEGDGKSRTSEQQKLVEEYQKQLYNDIMLKREMNDTKEQMNQALIEGQRELPGAVSSEVPPTESATQPVSEEDSSVSTPYQDRTNSVPSPSDAELANNADETQNETQNESKSDAYVMGQNAYQNGDADGLKAIDHNDDVSKARLKRAFADDEVKMNVVVKAYEDGEDMEQFVAQRAVSMTPAQQDAVRKYVEAQDAKKGVYDTLQHADDGYGDALKEQLWPYQTEDGNIVPATLTTGQQVFLKKANEYGGGFVVVPGEDGNPTIKQVSHADIKEVGTPIPLDDYINQKVYEQQDARYKQFRSQFDGSGLKPSDTVEVAMEAGEEPMQLTFAGYTQDGKIVLSDGEDNITLTKDKFNAWRQNALDASIGAELDAEEAQRANDDAAKAEEDKKQRYNEGIVGLGMGQPDYSSKDTEPKVAAEYLQEQFGDDHSKLMNLISGSRSDIKEQLDNKRKAASEYEDWLSINADLDPEKARKVENDLALVNEQIADLETRYNNWNTIRKEVMTPEEVRTLKDERKAEIEKAGVDDSMISSSDEREVPVLDNKELKKQYPTMDEAEKYIASERKRIYKIQSDEVQPQIDGINETLEQYMSGDTDYSADQLKELNTTKAQLEARQANLSASAKDLKAQAKLLNTLYRAENEEASAKALEEMTPSERRKALVADALKKKDFGAIKEIYKYASTDVTDLTPQTLEEAVSEYLRPHILNPESLQEELDKDNFKYGIGKGYDSNKFNYILAKKGTGLSVKELAEMVFNDLPINLQDLGYTDQDVRNTFLDMLKSYDSVKEMRNVALMNRIAAAEDELSSEEEYYEAQKEREIMERQAKNPDYYAYLEDKSVPLPTEDELNHIAGMEYDRMMEIEEREREYKEYVKSILPELADYDDRSNEEGYGGGSGLGSDSSRRGVVEGNRQGEEGGSREASSQTELGEIHNSTSEGRQENGSLASGEGSANRTSHLPQEASFGERLKNAIAETEPNPSEAQKKAGNYKKGHLSFGGYDFTVETPKGTTRSGKDEQGKPWSVTMHDTYGYIKGKIGVDGDHIDMFINDDADLDDFNGNVYVVDQVNPETGEFDEHKVMYGYPSEEAAKDAYLANYSKGWKGLGKITAVPKATFDKWLESSDRKTKPFADYAIVKPKATTVIKGDKWNATGEPEKYKASTKKHANSHDVVWTIGKKRYGSTTAERDMIETLLEDYKGGVPLWNAYEKGDILLSPNEAAIIKAVIKENENQQPIIKFDKVDESGSALKPTRQEEVLRDAVIGKLRESGMDVITDVEEGQRVLDSEKKNVRQQAMVKNLSKAANTIKSWLTNNRRNQFFTLELPEETQKQIRNKLGRDFDSHVISANNVAHAKSNHGVKGKKITSNSIPLRDEDFELIPYIMTKPSYVERGSEDITGRESIRFYKTLSNGYAVVVEKEQKNSPNDMETITMWAEKSSSNGADAQSNVGKSPAIDAQDVIISTDDAAKIRKDAETAIENDGKMHENAEKTANGAKFFVTPDGEAYGYTMDGKIYIDPRIANSETPIHEYAHLWSEAVRSANPKEWENIVNLMKGLTSVWEKVKKEYPHLKSDSDIADEVLAQYSGKRGSERLRQEYEAIADSDESIGEKAKAMYALQRLKKVLDKFWKKVADFLHIHFTTAEEVADRVMKDLLDGIDPRAVLKEQEAKEFHSVIDQMFDDENFDKSQHLRERYDLGKTPEWMQEIGIKGDNFSLSFKSIKVHQGKDSDHDLTKEEWHALPEALKHPFVITRYQGAKDRFRLYVNINHDGKPVAVGMDVKRVNQGKNKPQLDVNSIKTVFAHQGIIGGGSEVLVTYDKEITPKQQELLRGLNFHEYPTVQELSAAKIRKSSETTKENAENLSDEDKIKFISQQFGVDENDVAMYANAIKKGSTAEAARARANIRRHLMHVNEENIFSLRDIVKYTKPVNDALKENFGDLDAMIEERKKQVEVERNVMEAARKRAEEEEVKRKKHLEELSMLSSDAIDKQYMDAVNKNEEATAREMLDEAARRKGYGDTESDYQGVGAWKAPSNPGYDSDKARREDLENSGSDVNLEDMALGYTPQPDDYFTHPERYSQNTPHGLESTKAIKNALDALKRGEKDVKVKVYRAVPTSVKEGKLRNGDWVTPSKKYAQMHGDNRLEGKYRIIEDEVPANQLWWDGNDANEFGFDDGKEYKYKNAKNNRKLNDLVTRDDKGNIILPSLRFNSRKKDIRFMFAGEKGAAEADKADEQTIRMDNLDVAKKMEKAKKDAKAIKLATGWERGADGKWRYEIPDIKRIDFVGNLQYIKNHPDYARYVELVNKMNRHDFGLSDVDLTETEKKELAKLSKTYDDFVGRKMDNNYDLGAFVDAPELFKAYPKLSDVKLYFVDNENDDAAGWFTPSDNAITINKDKVVLHADYKSVLAHEIQHAIQYIEGFAKGGNSENIRERVKKLMADLEEDANLSKDSLEEYKRINTHLIQLQCAKQWEKNPKSFLKSSAKYTVPGYYMGTPKKEQIAMGQKLAEQWKLEANQFVMSRNSYREPEDYGVMDNEKLLKKWSKQMADQYLDDKETAEKFDKLDKALHSMTNYELYRALAGEVEARNVEARIGMSDEERRNSLASETEDVDRADQIVMDGDGASYSIVKDPEIIKKLDKEDTVKVYRAMQVGEDGKLYPPMAAKVNGKFVQPIELGKWEQADERPELADNKGMFTLNKGNGKSLKAAYNPYLHTSRTPLNDQFSEAQNRPNIVTVEVEVPKSELTSGYKADKAKDAVGEVEWKAGIIQGQLTGKRKVILSRWDKPVRIVPDSEVADVIVNDMFKGKNITMPTNVVTPSLRKELEKRGVPFVETDNRGRIIGGENDGVHYSKVYGKKSNVKARLGSEPVDENKANDFAKIYRMYADDEYGLPDYAETAVENAKENIEKELRESCGNDPERFFGMMSEDDYDKLLKLTNASEFGLDVPKVDIVREDFEDEREELYDDAMYNLPGEMLKDVKNIIKYVPKEVIDAVIPKNPKVIKMSRLPDEINAQLQALTGMSHEEVLNKYGVDNSPQMLTDEDYEAIHSKQANVKARLSDSFESEKMDVPVESQRKIADSVVNTANQLGGAEAHVYTSLDDVPDEYRPEVEQGAKGWYDPETHTVHVYLPNCEDGNDAQRTVFHEKIGHEGMEVLLGGEQGVRKFADFVYKSVDKETRGKILDFANKYDPDWSNPDRINIGTQEYIAHMAEEGPTTAEDFSLWTKIKHYLIKVLKKLGIRVPGLLNDKDLRYYLMKAGKALHVWDNMSKEKQEAMMAQATNAEIRDALSDGAGKGKPRRKKGESTIQYIKRVQEWRRWKEAREDTEDPEPPQFYDFDKDAEGKKEWERLNKEWRDSHGLKGDEMPLRPERKEGESDEAFVNRYKEWEKWNKAILDKDNPMPDMFAFEKQKQMDATKKYEDWLARHELLEQQQADLDLYEGKIYPAETNPEADALEQRVMQDLAEATSTDVSKEGAARTVKHAVIHRRKNMEEASADDAIYINDVKNRIAKMADSGAFDKLLSDYQGKPNKAEKLAEAIPYIIEAPRRLRDLAHELNNTGAFDKGHIHIQPADVEAIQPFVEDLAAETAKKHTELKNGKEVEVYNDPKAVSEVASKMAQAINQNHQKEEDFVPIDGTDILSEHVLPLVMQQVVPKGLDYKNLSPEMKATIDSIRDWYNYTYDWLKDNNTLKADTGYNVDYVNHIWDKEKSDKQAYAMYVENRQRTKSPNEKPRTISTLMEGINVGLVPKTTDITKMMAYYSRSNIEAWANKTMLQEVSGLNVVERNEDGDIISSDPLLSSTAPFNLEQYKYFEIPGVGPVWVYNVSPKQVTVKNPITGKDKVLYSEASAGDRFGVVFDTYQSTPFWKAFDTTASSMKKLELGFSGFHAGALTEVYMVQNMVEYGPKKAMANFMKYIFIDTMKNHQLPCFANPQDFQEAATHLVKFGATNDYAAADVQNMFDNFRDFAQKLHKKLEERGNIGTAAGAATIPFEVATQMVSMLNKGMDVVLWDFLHDGLKLATYRLRADRTKERAKKYGWTDEQLSKALDEDGQFVNDMFGGQHWDVLGASQRKIRIAGRCLLSPDWNASTTRHFLALTGFGSVWSEATFENFKQYYKHVWNAARGKETLSPEDWLRMGRQLSAFLCLGIGFLIFYEGFANAFNAAFRALDEEKERKKAEEIRKANPNYRSPYELAYPDGMKWFDYLMRGNSLGQQSKIFMGRYVDGTEMYIRHGKQFREIPEYFFNEKGEFEIPGPFVNRLVGKANPLIRMALDDYNYLSPYRASHSDKELQRKYAKLVGNEPLGKAIGLLHKNALYWAPFLIPSQENKEFKAVDFYFPSSKGFSPWKAQSYFKDFILSGDMEGIVMTYQSCERNGIDPEAQIKAAIGSVKALESAEMKDGVTSLQVASERFDEAKSITEKKKMRQKMKKFLSQSEYKAFTQKEALDMVQSYLNGEDDLKEMEKAENKYLMKAKSEDVTEDWRIQAVWNGTMETYDEYQRLKDVDKAKANAFKNSKTNKRLFDARKAISAAKKKMNKAKKQMNGQNDATEMAEIRKIRKELLKTLNGME